MPNETNTPQDTEAEANAARRILGLSPRNALLAGAAIVAGGALFLGPTISNEIKKDDRASALHAESQHQQDVLLDIQTKSQDKKIDPANIAGMFMINERNVTLNQISTDIAHSQPEYINGDEATKIWIDYTVLESGKAQGSYNIGDNFVETRIKIDGKDTLIVQDASKLQLPMTPALKDPSTIPAPNTH